MNNTQRFFLDKKNLDKAKEIVKHFHPELSDEEIERIKISTQYDWVVIGSKKANLGIEFNHRFSGMGITLGHFEKAYKEDSFRIWRFWNDSHYKNKPEIPQDEVNKLMKAVPRPSPNQMFKYYYAD